MPWRSHAKSASLDCCCGRSPPAVAPPCSDAEVARPYLAEAIELARALGDTWRMSQVLCWQAFTATVAGEPAAALEAGNGGMPARRRRSETVSSRGCADWGVGNGAADAGEFAGAAAQFRELVAEAEAAHDPFGQLAAQSHLAPHAGLPGDADGARTAAADRRSKRAPNSAASWRASATRPLALAALAAGDVAAATEAGRSGLRSRWARIPYPAANVDSNQLKSRSPAVI